MNGVCSVFLLLNMAVFRSENEIFSKGRALQVTNTSQRMPKQFLYDIVLSLEVSNQFLRDLQINQSCYPNLTLVDIFNAHLTSFRIIQGSKLENRIRRAISDVSVKYQKNKSGPSRLKLLSNSRKISIFEDEIVNFNHYEEKIEVYDKSLIESEAKCSLLWEEIMLLRRKVPSHRKEWDEITSKQQSRRLTSISEDTKKALSFLDALGFSPHSLTVSANDKELKLDLGNDDFQTLEEAKKERLRCVVSIMDRFGISDAAYHELSQHFTGLPRTHNVIRYRTETSSELTVHRVTSGVVGAYVSFIEDLNKVISQCIERRTLSSKEITVKISGDGTRVSRSSNFVVFSYQIMDVCNNGLHTLAIVKCQETYHSIKDSLSHFFDEISTIASEGSIVVGKETIQVNIVFSSDMKMLQLILGLGGSTGLYACPWCKVHRDDRWKTDKPLSFYNVLKDMIRSLIDLKESAETLAFGVKHLPLLEIPLRSYVVDELHLLLRITDVLERNLIHQAKSRDNAQGKKSSKTPSHLNNIVNAIRSCGVSFHVWQDKNTEGTLRWTSLTGVDKRKLLSKLPEKLKGILPSESEATIITIWTVFSGIFKDLVYGGADVTPESLYDRSTQWLRTFLSLGGKEIGYGKVNVTPYMHVFVHHAPYMFSLFGPLGLYSCQAVEKLNDSVKAVHQKKSNKWDAAKDALTVQTRLEFNQEISRTKRKYDKIDKSFWDHSLLSLRQAKRQDIRDEELLAFETIRLDTDALTIPELRDVLEKEGVNTKSTKRDKLLKLVEKELQ